MNWFAAPDYRFARLVFERGLAVIYAIAFIAAGLGDALAAALAAVRAGDRGHRRPGARFAGALA